ncbi:MAG: filamentous hemagglutinin N-terminal domain-containing protein [Thermosynechococcaceae cyanobacterium]
MYSLRVLILGLYLSVPARVAAQSVPASIVPDQTLPTRSQVVAAPNSQQLQIRTGTQVNQNLFHSFSQFSVPNPQTIVHFQNGVDISNVIVRVTGALASDIQGTLRANGQANLFLLNPNGIQFGDQARLQIGGSFVAATADRFLFDGNQTFSAVNPEAPSLLTVSAPIGLQYGQSPGPIALSGPGNQLEFDPITFEIVRTNRPQGLAVLTGKTLGLLGGKVTLAGGNLTAPNGRVALGSVANSGIVTLNPDNLGWQFDHTQIEAFDTIEIGEAASVDISGSGGEIQVQGQFVSVSDGSALLANALGTSGGGQLTIRATEGLEVAGTSMSTPFASVLSTYVGSTASGQGGTLRIQTPYLLVRDGGQISSGTFGPGASGNIEVQAGLIEVAGGSDFGPSGLFTPVAAGATGSGGNISLVTDRLGVFDGAQIFVSTFGDGDAGSLNITAQDVLLDGAAFGVFPSSLLANVEAGATGQGGDISIKSDRLSIQEGAQISAITLGSGSAGNIAVTAQEIELQGISRGNSPSGIFANVEENAFGSTTGSGGTVLLEAADRIRISDGARVTASTFSQGTAGEVRIRAGQLTVTGGTPNGPSAILADTVDSVGGSIFLTADQLQVTDGAQVGTTTFGAGQAGVLDINARQINLIGGVPEGRSGLFATAVVGTGNGGDIIVRAQQLTLQEGAVISASNFPSTSLLLPPGEGAAGNLEVTAATINLDNASLLSAETFAGDRGNIRLQTEQLTLRRQSQITTNAQGTASGGNIVIDAGNGVIVAVPSENSDISANAIAGNGGRVDITTQGIFGLAEQDAPTPESDITASSESGIAGVVNINTVAVDPNQGLLSLPEATASPKLAQGCQPGSASVASRFINSGRGGIRTDPFESRGSNPIIGDIRWPRQWQSETFQSSTRNIQEARGWQQNKAGQVMLISELPVLKNSSFCQVKLQARAASRRAIRD